MKLSEKSWEDHVKLAAHYKAIGGTDIYLYNDAEPPWKHATFCEAGASHRLDIATSVSFKAEISGLKFSWSFDIEPRSANGSGTYHIDVDGIMKVMAKLPEKTRGQFAAYLASCADAVEKKGAEYQEVARKQYGDAAALRKLTAGK